MTDFEFNELTDKDIKYFYNNAYIFNVTRKMMANQAVVLNSIRHKDFGKSSQKVDFYLKLNDNSNKFLSLNSVIEVNNYFMIVTGTGSGYYNLAGILDILEQKNIEFEGLLIITRTLSNFITDKQNYGSYSTYYNLCEDQNVNLFLNSYPAIYGLFAKNRITLTDYNSIKKAFDELYKEKKLSFYLYKDYLEKYDGFDFRTK